jgi:hypothetical protein
MTVSVRNIAFDCADPYSLAQFWSRVTEQPISPEDRPGDPETSVDLPNGVTLHFNQVPEGKVVKNRVHVCLRPDGPRDEEVDRIMGLGATMATDHRRPDGTGWAVLADPEGNEFCVLRSVAEHPQPA